MKKLQRGLPRGRYSKHGYKRNSPDVNKPFNIIPSGNITMKGVDFPVKGIDNLGNEQIMYPGLDYIFPGDYVLELPMMQPGGQYYTPASDNTRVNYTPVMTVHQKGNWLNELIANNVTAYGFFGTSDDFVAPNDKLTEINYQFKKLRDDLYKKYNYTITSKQKMPEKLKAELKEVNKKREEELLKIAYNIKSKEKINLPNINPTSFGERFENYRKTGNIYFPNIRPENINASQDALYMHQRLPQKYNSFVQSKYKPTDSKNLNTIYYSFSPNIEKEIVNDLFKYDNSDFIKSKDKFRQVKGSHVAQAALKDFQYSKGKDKKGDYVAYYDINDYGNILDYIPNSKPFEIYNRIYYKDYGDGKPKRMYYSDKELSELNINKKDFDTLALQRELANRGYTLPESTKQDGTFDGVFGDETKNALLDYQAKHVKNRKQFGGNFSSSYEYDPEMMFIDKYNTPLTPAEERKFKMWAAEESKRQGRNILMDMGAYDLKGFWKSGDYKRMDQDNHGSDTWKKPNHPTFSNESIYHGVDGWYGGNWTKNAGYQPSKQMLELYTPNYYKRMFGTEPHRPEYLDMSRYESGINAPTPMYYKQGGQHGGTLPKAQSAGQTSSTPFRFYDYQTSPTYSGGTLPEVMVSSDNVPYPYYNRLTPEEKKFFNQDNPIGRSVRSIANTGKRGQTYNDLSRVAKDIESFGAEMTGIPGTIRFSKSPLEKLAGAGRTIEATILGSSPFITSPYNQEDVADAFDALDALGFATTAAGLVKMPLQKAANLTGKYLTQGPLKNAYRLNPVAAKQPTEVILSRVQRPGQTADLSRLDELLQKSPESLTLAEKIELARINQPGYGRGFSSNPNDISYYSSPGIQSSRGYVGMPEIRSIRLPAEEAARFNIRQNPVEGYFSGAPGREYLLPRNYVESSKTLTPQTFEELEQIRRSIDAETTALNTPHWWRGYPTTNTPKQLPSSGNVDDVVLKNLRPENAQIIKSQYGEFTPEQLKLLKPVDMQLELVSPPKKTYRNVFDPTKGRGSYKEKLIKKVDKPITSTKIAKQKATELSPHIYEHDSRMNVGLSTLQNKSDALNVYGTKQYKGAEYYQYRPDQINDFFNTPTWIQHFKVDPNTKILDAGAFYKFHEAANKLGWSQKQKADYLQKLGYDAIKKWENSPEIQFLNPSKNLTLKKLKKILPNDIQKHQYGGIITPPAAIGVGAYGVNQKQNAQPTMQEFGGSLPKAQSGIFGTIPTPPPFMPQKENVVTFKKVDNSPKIKVNTTVPDEMITIKDGRKIRLTTGQAINPNTDLIGKSYPTKALRSILNTAKNRGLSKDDALTLAAIDLQETRWGETDNNMGHVLYKNGFAISPPERFINAYLKSKETADRLKLSDEYTRLQVYNGLGKVTPDTEKGYHGFRMKKIYGVPVPESGIDMKKNPLYGKQIVDIRDNVLKQNSEFLKLVDEYYKMGGITNEMLDVYKNYINGVYTNTEKEKDAIKIYDKLNRKYYREAKNANKSVPNYIMSLIK